ncbi:g8056 [Coccomyxa elongata]
MFTLGTAILGEEPCEAFSGPTGLGALEMERRLTDRITEFELANGLHFIVMERHNAPIVSVHTYANVGAFDEVSGQTGIAHLLEHMAFKGSVRLGTKDYQREAALLNSVDEAFYAFWEAHEAGQATRAKQLYEQLQALEARAGQLVEPNAFGSLLQRSGAVGLNATTSHDATKYFMSLPANKLELWFALEAERFRAPVFRELYSEKRVVAEERRSRIDATPLGRFQEAFLGAALANNYARPVIGYERDVAALGRREVEAFFRRHYGPRNLVITVVGDTTPEQVRNLAEKYFGGWRQEVLPSAAPCATEALARPTQGALELQQAARAGPAVMQAFYRPSVASADAPIFDVISDILSTGRTARFNANLVQRGVAYTANAVSSYPGDKHSCAMLLYALPISGVGLPAMEQALWDQLSGLADTGPTQRELLRIKKAAKVTLVDALRSNSGMASALAAYHVLTGSWQSLLKESAIVEQLTPEDVRAVAARTFTQDNCFKGLVLPLKA